MARHRNTPGASNSVSLTVQSAAKPTGTIYVAWTFDDGPGPATQPIRQTLDGRKIPATFYVVRARKAIAGWASYLEGLKDSIHEIAIHEGFVGNAASRARLTGDDEKDIDHLRWFPAPASVSLGGSYRDIGFAMKDIDAFRNLLTDGGMMVSFVRPPGGLMSEIRDCLRLYSGKQSTIGEARNLITLHNEIAEGRAKIDDSSGAERDVLDQLALMRREVARMKLRLWGGPRKRTPALYSDQSWDSETKMDGSTSVQALEKRIASLDTVNPDPYLVILCHDLNMGYAGAFERDLKRFDEIALAKNVSIEYVTMSQLYEKVVGAAKPSGQDEQDDTPPETMKIGAFKDVDIVAETIEWLVTRRFATCVTYDGEWYRVFVRKSQHSPPAAASELSSRYPDTRAPTSADEFDFSEGTPTHSFKEIDNVRSTFVSLSGGPSFSFLVTYVESSGILFQRVIIR